MRRSLLLLAGVSALLGFTAASSGPREYLFQNQRVCDASAESCIRGTLAYHSNPRVLHLRARVLKAPGPGLFRIRLSGANELGHSRVAPFEVRVRGNYSEIINHKVIPDHPDVEEWMVERIDFVPD